MDLDHPKSKWTQPDLIGWMLFRSRYPLPQDPKQPDAFGYQKEISTNPLDFVGHIGGGGSHLLPGSSCVHLLPPSSARQQHPLVAGMSWLHHFVRLAHLYAMPF